jgi:putative PIN family toxin of toxin-antitoxin system
MNANGDDQPSRAVVDTNLLISGLITRTGTPAALVDALIARRFTLLSSAELVAEPQDVLSRPRMARYRLDSILIGNLLQRFSAAEQVTPRSALPLQSRDPKDDKFLVCALTGGADYLVTGDKDLLALQGDPHLGAVRIVTAREFLTAIGVSIP